MGNEIGNVCKFFGYYKDKKILIIGAGSTIKDYEEKIKSFIKENNCITIGINNMTHLFKPYFHLWTNNKRLETFKNCINYNSKLIFGYSLTNGIKEYNRESVRQDYYRLNYADHRDLQIQCNNGQIYGYFRTAGCLAIYLAYLLGSNEIFVAGMDGYTLKYNGDQHCYGSGDTDNNTIEYEEKKDNTILYVLHNLKNCGIKFKIITPTVYKDFYNENVLATDTK